MTFGGQASWNDVQFRVYHSIMWRLHDQQVVVDEELGEWVCDLLAPTSNASTPLQWLHALNLDELSFTTLDITSPTGPLQIEGTVMEGTGFDLGVNLRSEEGSWTLTLDDRHRTLGTGEVVSMGSEQIADPMEAVALLFAELLTHMGGRWFELVLVSEKFIDLDGEI